MRMLYIHTLDDHPLVVGKHKPLAAEPYHLGTPKPPSGLLLAME
jgi:hypothetical protein